MKNILKKIIPYVLLSLFIVSCSISLGNNPKGNKAVSNRNINSINIPPSQEPPRGIPVSQTPQFVTFGWEDNGKSDGVKWANSLMAGRLNPAGSGSSYTYDGTPASSTFFEKTDSGINWYSESPTLIKRSWRESYLLGQEIGIHTMTHGHGDNYSISKWRDEIDSAIDFLAQPFDPNELVAAPNTQNGIGIPRNEILGFRAPFFEYNDYLFDVLKERGLYDSSIEEGFEYSQDGTNFYWPYTLDNGSPGHEVQVEWGMKNPIKPHPGLIEMPVYALIVPPELRQVMKARVSWFDEASGKISGTDYNIWVTFKMTKSEALATLKYSLDLRLQGNRAPFMLATNSELYSSTYNTPSATYLERREALTEFLDYVQSKPVVRVVSIKDIIKWIVEPNQISDVTITPASGANGSISPNSPVKVKMGSDYKFIIKPDPGFMVDSVQVNGLSLEVKGHEIEIPNVIFDTTIEVTFKPIPQGDKYQAWYSWVFNPAEEPVDMNSPLVDLFDNNGNIIATIPEEFAKRIAMEGRGFLPDGRLIVLSNDYDWPKARFKQIDTSIAPWGYDFSGAPLVPFKSLGVDTSIIPLGSEVYIEEFVGIQLPDGNTHDGWYKATDYTHPNYIDIFVGSYSNYKYLTSLINWPKEFIVIAPYYLIQKYIITSSVINGTITSVQEVIAGNDATFVFEPTDPGYVLDYIKIDGQIIDPITYNFYTFKNVRDNHAIEVSYKGWHKPPLDCGYSINTDWGTGFGANLVLTNNTGRTIKSWIITLTYSGNQQVSGWNGIFSQVDNVVTIKNMSWNGRLPVGTSLSIGLNVSYSGFNEFPDIHVDYEWE